MKGKNAAGLELEGGGGGKALGMRDAQPDRGRDGKREQGRR